MKYRLRILLELAGRRANIDFHYDGTPKWTRVEEVGNTGGSSDLLEKLHQLMGAIA
jgi:hypothetical protein